MNENQIEHYPEHDLKKIDKEKEAMLTAIRRMIDVQQERVDNSDPA